MSVDRYPQLTICPLTLLQKVQTLAGMHEQVSVAPQAAGRWTQDGA
jgi:hypothetical protein